LTAKNVFGCTQTAIRQSVELFADITNLNNQGKDLAGTVPRQIVSCLSSGFTKILGCLQDLSATIISKYLLILSSQLSDIYQLINQGVHLPSNLTRCGNDQILKATADVGAIITNIGQCMRDIAEIS
jgi:hypothetical protein